MVIIAVTIIPASKIRFYSLAIFGLGVIVCADALLTQASMALCHKSRHSRIPAKQALQNGSRIYHLLVCSEFPEPVWL